MNPLLERIARTEGCSIEDWPFPEYKRGSLDSCPADLASISKDVYSFHLFEKRVDSGLVTTPNSFEFKPDFKDSVARTTFLHDDDYNDPNLQGFLNSYTIGYFGMGNSQLILDLTQPDFPKYRFFYFYIIEPFESYSVVAKSFEEFGLAMLDNGPHSSLIDKKLNSQ